METEPTFPFTLQQALRPILGLVLALLVAGSLAIGLARRCCGRLVPRSAAMACCGSDRVCDRSHQPACAPVQSTH